ncbi:MAG: Xaa-Pro peptidase family protein [Pseudomonadota bacterium]
MTPPRGFPDAEHGARLAAIQVAMAGADLAALLLTTAPEIRYVTGFLTRFWESPTRPWFVVLPVEGDPVAVIPEIGEAPMRRAGVRDIRTWPSPQPADEGAGLLAHTLREVAGPAGRVGLPMGPETHLRMPLSDWDRLRAACPALSFVGDGGLMRRQRMVKSPAEIAKIETACAIAGRAFDRLPQIARAGVPLEAVFRGFQALCLEEGADWIPYLAGAAGQEGYADVISPATDTPLAPGDVLMLDTGLVHDGYFCDFDRNLAVGQPLPGAAAAHAQLLEAVEAGAAAVRPGARAADLFAAMAGIVGAEGSVGRLGHGLGLSLTEPPSLTVADETVLAPGMVLTLEPAVTLGTGRLMVHEENLVVTDAGCRFLSPRATGPIPVLEG